MAATSAGLITYAADRGQTITAGSDTDAALVRAVDYITYFYVAKMPASNPAPDATVEAATYEAAILELATPNFFSKTYTPGEAKALTKVDNIQWTMLNPDTGSEGMTPVSSKIEAMLGGYVVRDADRGSIFRSVG